MRNIVEKFCNYETDEQYRALLRNMGKYGQCGAVCCSVGFGMTLPRMARTRQKHLDVRAHTSHTYTHLSGPLIQSAYRHTHSREDKHKHSTTYPSPHPPGPTHLYIHAHTSTSTHIDAHTVTHIHAHTHTYTHTHTRTHTHTHTHTHTRTHYHPCSHTEKLAV